MTTIENIMDTTTTTTTTSMGEQLTNKRWNDNEVIIKKKKNTIKNSSEIGSDSGSDSSVISETINDSDNDEYDDNDDEGTVVVSSYSNNNNMNSFNNNNNISHNNSYNNNSFIGFTTTGTTSSCGGSSNYSKTFNNPLKESSIDLCMMWLQKSIEKNTLQEHICEKILKLPDKDFQFYLPQIVHVCIVYNHEPIVTMLLEKCRASFIIAAQSFFLIESIVKDNHPKTYNNAKYLWKRCELASIGSQDTFFSGVDINNMNGNGSSNGNGNNHGNLNNGNNNGHYNGFNDLNYLPSNIKKKERHSLDQLSDSSTLIIENWIEQQSSTSMIDDEVETFVKLSNSQVLPPAAPPSTPAVSSPSLQQHQQQPSTTSPPLSPSGSNNFSFSTVINNPGKNQNKPMLASTSSNSYTFFFDLLQIEVEENDDGNTTTSNIVVEDLVSNIPSSLFNSPPLSPSTSTSSFNNNSNTTNNTTTTTTTNNNQISNPIKKIVKKFNYQQFYSEIHFINILSKVAKYLLTIPMITDKSKQRDMRNVTLRVILKQLNDQMFSGENKIFLPVYPPFLVLSICHEEACCLNSRDRIPFLIVLEVKKSTDSLLYQDPNYQKEADEKLFEEDDSSDEDDSDDDEQEEEEEEEEQEDYVIEEEETLVDEKETGIVVDELQQIYDEEVQEEKVDQLHNPPQPSQPSPSPSLQSTDDSTNITTISPNTTKITTTRTFIEQSQSSQQPSQSQNKSTNPLDNVITKETKKFIKKVITITKNRGSGVVARKPKKKRDLSSPIYTIFGELWKQKENRIYKTSLFSHHKGWGLISFIVKSGDDLRQEQLAMQLITQFHRIFKQCKLPIWLRPYLVVATGHDSGLIETVPDTISLDNLKKKDTAYTTLLDYYIRCYGDEKSKSFTKAQAGFIESLAGYSLVCYFLQIKDRHNGNILIDTRGHLIHIDYGFIFSTSPGSMNFEKAPFKLTKEFIDLMGGVSSDRFKYFTNLLVAGFIEVKKHQEEFIMMIELLLPHTNLSFIVKAGESSVDSFKERFRLDLTTPEQCEDYVLSLVNQSLNNWTTASYDSYQKFTNGINI